MQTPTSDKRIIKKYPNRRLYDTVESKYITLDDVRKLVLGGVPFCVVDKKSDEDITRNILLQIIIEQEEAGEPLFTTDALTQLITYYGDSVRGVASGFLDRSLALFADQQRMIQEGLTEAVRNNPITALTELTQQNLALWQRLQDDMFSAAGLGRTGSRTSAEQAPHQGTPQD